MNLDVPLFLICSLSLKFLRIWMLLIQKNCGQSLPKISREQRERGLNRRICLVLLLLKGRSHCSFKPTCILPKFSWKVTVRPEHVATHTSLILQWYLISCTKFVVDVRIDSLLFQNGAMLIDEGKTKTNQEGTRNIEYPWHLYGNTEHPYIWYFLALGNHLISNPNILAGKCAIFEGSGQDDIYNQILFDLVSDARFWDQFVSLGMTLQYLWTHSVRKGAVTYISTGTTSCPPIASICLCANLSMPWVMNW